MNILRHFFGRRNRKETKQICIINASGFIEKRYRDAGGQTSPRDNFFVLRNLSHFAQREEIETIAIFTGRPLKEAGEGAFFKGVKVYYSPDERTLLQKIKELTRSCSSKKDTIVITDDRHVEKEVIPLGAQCMRLATLKKAMERNNEPERQPYETLAKPAAWRGQRRQFQPQPKTTTETEQPEETDQSSDTAGKAETEKKTDKNVLDLIDPI